MRCSDMLQMSLSSLLKRKIRTVLTVAGVTIGTCAIVSTVSLSLGIQQSMNETLATMGDLTLIQIYNYNPAPDATPLDSAMVDTIRAMPEVAAVTPVLNQYGSFLIRSGKYQYQDSFTGVDFSALGPLGYQLLEGALPEEGAPEGTILVGQNAQYSFVNPKRNNQYWGIQYDENGNPVEPDVDVMTDKLELEFVITDPENNTKVRPVRLTCAGVMMEDYNKNPSPGYTIFLDIDYMEKLIQESNRINGVKEDPTKPKNYENVVVKVGNINQVAQVEDAIQAYGFQTSSMETIREPLMQQSSTIQLILGSLGGITLVVAALGIVNTMTMSIYERTREIGVMKVLGCVVGNIRAMFLVEAASIGFLGGIAGVLLSYGATSLLNMLLSTGSGMGMMGLSAGTSAVMPPWLVLAGILFATLVGLVAGIYPANRAVRISAIAAIHQE